MRLHHYKLFVLAFLISGMMSAQQQISGTVQGEGGLPLPGVNIIIQGKSTGTQTDFDGQYTINAATGEVLVYSYLGFVTQQVTVSGQNEINVVLKEDVGVLEEVVVVGFGTQSKRLLTGNVSKIEAAQIGGISTPSVQNALIAKAPGVQITQINGKLEGGVKVIIRGLSSISASQEPLYVIDGIEMNNRNSSSIGANLNPLLTVNPNDIASIDILKDASATAIYGAKGTNGVILITTKRGKEGKSQVSVDLSTAFGKPTNKRDWLNASQYEELLRESAFNRFGDQVAADDWVDNRLPRYEGDQDWRTLDTDWQEEAFQDSYINDLNVSISGGNEKTVSFISGSTNDSEGIIRGNGLKRYSMRANIDHNVSKSLSVGVNASYSSTVINRIAGDNAFVTPLQVIAQVPTSPTHLLNGEPNGTVGTGTRTLYANFLLQDKHSFRKTSIRRILAKVFGDIDILPSLTLRSEFGYDYLYQTVDRNTGRLAPFQSTNGQSFASDDGTEILSTNNYFTYDYSSGGASSLNFVLGMTYTRLKNRANSVTGDGFPTDSFRSVSSAATISAGTGTFTNWAQLAYFARASYDFKKRYLINATLRHDSSSRFGKDKRNAFFPAVSVGWIVSEENFLHDSSILSNLKLRASWGVNGNTPTANFGSLALYGGTNYGGVSGIAFTQIDNPDLKWEETAQQNFGLDFGFLNNRITGEIDYYVKKTDDLIFNQRLPYETGAPNNAGILKNIGNLENKGFEFVLNTINVQTDNLTWETSFNIATNKNEIVSLPNGDDLITGQNILREGEPINSFYMVEYAGVNPANGDAEYILNTTNADGTINRGRTNDFSQAERIIAGNPNPDLFGGLTSTLNYKTIDFSFTFQGQWGAQVFNGAGQYQETGFGNGLDNQDVYIYENRWQNPGDITDVPQARLFLNNGHSNSTRYLQDADFIRLRNITLGYSLPQSALDKLGMNKIRLYVSGLNLLTFTDFRGYDPESTNDDANTNTNVGSTFYSAPPAKVYTLGVNLTF
ncbi:TonB-dependent receptor [Aquimarina sp. AU58]|uniref:SusC/RagA family TonB-linked outer membrane protein n=1 Tax=Aquimarina sp. AU58 TaxID=1874112 RepID=UPI000D6411C7|nr:TonB-dependent receptor [Aquimarina sp. AU58]